MSKPQNVMLVSIALTAATVCTARACTKRLDETQWPETRHETYWAETEIYCSRDREETRDASVRDRDVEDFVRDETLVRLETVSRPRRLDRDHIPAKEFAQCRCEARPAT